MTFKHRLRIVKGLVQYLGIMIDSELSWKHHTDFVCDKISRSVEIIAKMRHCIPCHLLLNFIPCTYCSLFKLWYLCSQTYLNKMLVTTQYLFYWIKLLPFAVFVLSTVKLFYDVHAKTAPKSLLDTFAKINTKHHSNTPLSAKECFSVKFSRTEKMRKSFTRIAVSIWNSIPLSVKTLNISNFRKKKNNEIKN